MADPLKDMALQSLPLRTPLGRRLRDAFTQPPLVISADYASLEARIMAQTAPLKDLADLLLEATDRQLDAGAKAKIRTWDKPAKAVQILEVLDLCVHGSLCSEFMIVVLRTMLDRAIQDEKTTYHEVVAQATWRQRGE